MDRALLFLVISNIVLIAINFLQILLLDRITKNYMIYAPSAGILLLFIAGALGYTVFHASRIREVWRDAQRKRALSSLRPLAALLTLLLGAKKTSWVGAILAIMLPVIVCQFFYLTLWGFPEHQQKQWTTEMVNSDVGGLRPPYLYIKEHEGVATLMNGLSSCKNVTFDSTTRCDQYMAHVTRANGSIIDGQQLNISDESLVLKGQGYYNYIQINSNIQCE